MNRGTFESCRITFCGTLDYMSPEVLRGDNQSYEVDIWALGILLFELFHDNTPFKGKTPTELLNNIIEKKPKVLPGVPKDAKDLILRLLVVDPAKRITLDQIKDHPFVLRYPCDLTDPNAGEDSKKDSQTDHDTQISEKMVKETPNDHKTISSKEVNEKSLANKESKLQGDKQSGSKFI